MNSALVFSVGSLGFWVFIALLVAWASTMCRSVLLPQEMRKEASLPPLLLAIFSAIALSISTICGVPQTIPGGAVKLPVVWPVLPFTAWFLIGSLIWAAARAWKRMFDPTKALFGALVPLAVSVLAFALFERNGESAQMVRGSVTVSWAALVASALLLVLTSALIGYLSTKFRAWRTTKAFATHFALLLGCIVFGLPFFWLVLTSFKEDRDVTSKAGIVWLPHVQRLAPIEHPKTKMYWATFRGQTVQGTVLEQTRDGRVRLDIIHPLSLRGFTTEALAQKLREVTQFGPIVSTSYSGQIVEAVVEDESASGLMSIEITDPPAVRGIRAKVLPANVTRLRVPGVRPANYSDALEYLPIESNKGLIYLQNTIVIAVLSVIGTILSSSLVAYGFSRVQFPGRDLLFAVLLGTMMLPQAITLLPQFLIFKHLGWIDTLLPLWAPAFFASAFNVFLLRQFFRQIPSELEESARIDGANHLKTYWSVMLPQVKPALAVIGIWTFMGAWNNFIGPLIYINSPEKMTVSYAVQLFATDRLADPGLVMAFATMAVIPVLLLFFFTQRFFMEGVTLSGFGGK